MYIESSSPRRRGDAARLWTPNFNPKRGQCVSFWYHMFGRTMGTLNIYAADMTTTNPVIGSPIWTLSGNQGNAWMQEYISLPTPTVASVSESRERLGCKTWITFCFYYSFNVQHKERKSNSRSLHSTTTSKFIAAVLAMKFLKI